jgi:membrane-bound ClpP family serine protease
MPWVKVFFICLRRNIARREEMTGKKWLGLIMLLIGAGTLGYLALFNVGSGLLGVGGGITALVGYALLFGFSTGRKK